MNLEILFIVVFIIFVIIIYKQIKDKKNISNKYRLLSEEIEVKSDEIKKLNCKLEEMKSIEKISFFNINNIKNALEFYNSKENKKYIYTYEIKDKYSNNIKQQIAIVMFEDEIGFKQYVNLRCRVFVDGTSIDPILLKELYMNDINTVIIKDINLNKLCGRGIGTYIINTLEIILPQYGVREIKAPISSVDFHKRDRLKNFYCGINGFNMVKEVTKEEWGLAVKRIG
ncbi:hypothetical protein ACSXCN_04720 [Clostridium perfringens]